MSQEKRPVAQVFPPGDFIREELEARGWTQDHLARIIDRPVQAVNAIINAKKEITPATAIALGAAFGTSAKFWLNLETAYRLAQAAPADPSIAARARQALPKKTLRLAGNSPTTVDTLIKLHDWRGRAIHLYNLVTGKVRRIDKPNATEWASFSTAGVAIDPPSKDHDSTDAPWWIAFAKRQAARLGLTVEVTEASARANR